MNEPTTTPIPTATKKPRKPRITLTLKTPRAERRVDERIKAIHAEAAVKVAAYRRTQASARILISLLNRKLAKMTDDDKAKLRAALDAVVTLPLPMEGA